MIYCVEDDQSIRELVIYALKSQQIETSGFATGAELFDAISKKSPDLILLDIMLPDMDGMAILKKLRQNPNTKSIPIIMLTAKNAEYDIINALDNGADDYITKPFSVLEMISRIKAVQRRISTPKVNIITIGEMVIIPDKRIVKYQDEEIELTYKEYELLLMLSANKGNVLTREQLLENIWGYDYLGETRTVDVHIASLRQKLKQGGSMIKTVRNIGYKLENKGEI